MMTVSCRAARQAATLLGGAILVFALFAAGAANAQTCADESSMKSAQAGTAAVGLSFRNASNERRRIYWLDPNGERKLYGIVEPQHVFEQSSFPGFAWLITDDTEKCLSIVTATTEAQTIDVGDPSSAQLAPPAPGEQQPIAQVPAAAAAEPPPPADADQPQQAATAADDLPQVNPVEQFDLKGAFHIVPGNEPMKALNSEDSGAIEVMHVKPQWDSGQWSFVQVPNSSFVRIKNKWKSTYLADVRGRVRAVRAGEDSEESYWSFEPVDGTDFVQLRNHATDKFLLTVGGEAALAADLPPKRENRSYWKVISASQVDSQPQPVAAIDNDYTEALADCRAIGGIWTGSSCRAQREEVLTCPRGWRWSRRSGECQWAGRGDCPPWQRRNGRCLTQLTCRGGVVRQSGRGLSCHCPPGMAAWGNYPHLKCVPSLARIVPLLLQGAVNGGNRQGNGNWPGKFGGKNQLGGGKGQGNGPNQISGNKGPFNGKNGSPQQGGTQQGNGKTTTTVIDPKTGNKTVTQTTTNPKTGIVTRVQVVLDKNGRPLSIKGANTQQTAAPPVVKVVRPQNGKNGNGAVQPITSNNAATLKAQQDAAAKAAAIKAQQDAAAAALKAQQQAAAAAAAAKAAAANAKAQGSAKAKADAIKAQQDAIAKANAAAKAAADAQAKANAIKVQQDAAKAAALKAQQDAAAKANAIKAQQGAAAKANAIKVQQDAARAAALKAQQDAAAKANAIKAQQGAAAKANAIKAQQDAAKAAALKAQQDAAAKANAIKAQQGAAAKANAIKAQQDAARAAALKAQQNAAAKAAQIKAQQQAAAKAQAAQAAAAKAAQIRAQQAAAAKAAQIKAQQQAAAKAQAAQAAAAKAAQIRAQQAAAAKAAQAKAQAQKKVVCPNGKKLVNGQCQ